MSKRKDLDYYDKHALPAEQGDLRHPVEATCNVAYGSIATFPIVQRETLPPTGSPPRGRCR